MVNMVDNIVKSEHLAIKTPRTFFCMGLLLLYKVDISCSLSVRCKDSIVKYCKTDKSKKEMLLSWLAGTTWHTAGLFWSLRPNDTEIELLTHTRKVITGLQEVSVFKILFTNDK